MFYTANFKFDTTLFEFYKSVLREWNLVDSKVSYFKVHRRVYH